MNETPERYEAVGSPPPCARCGGPAIREGTGTNAGFHVIAQSRVTSASLCPACGIAFRRVAEAWLEEKASSDLGGEGL